jgi:uncharacterized protein (DUF305 family)
MASEAFQSIYDSSLPLRAARCAVRSAIIFGLAMASAALIGAPADLAQQAGSPGPSIVQPGAPGQPTKKLPADTKGVAPRWSQADVDFMQGMIMHHSQAVEMTDLLRTRSHNKDLRSLAERISISQSDEIKYMKQWLEDRGKPLEMDGMGGMNMADMKGMSVPLMPGMLTPQQMEALAKANGPAFDHLFLTGMIQHHNGALIMVDDLFNTAGAGQDNVLFDFATDVDNTQRAEIRIMQAMLLKEKR